MDQTQVKQKQVKQTQIDPLSKNQSSTNDLEILIVEYLAQMTDQERKVLDIAKDHLQSSFSMTKSIGFKSWLNNRGQ